MLRLGQYENRVGTLTWGVIGTGGAVTFIGTQNEPGGTGSVGACGKPRFLAQIGIDPVVGADAAYAEHDDDDKQHTKYHVAHAVWFPGCCGRRITHGGRCGESSISRVRRHLMRVLVPTW